MQKNSKEYKKEKDCYSMNDFDKIRNEIENKVKVKEGLIKKRREIRIKSKETIFAIHRNERSKAEKNINELRKKVENIIKHAQFMKEGLEEFAEAILFFNAVYNNKIVSREEVFGKYDELNDSVKENITSIYLGGLSDLTGELVRFSLRSGIRGNIENIEKAKKITETIFEFLIKLDLTGELRKKFDATRWNLDKITQILFDITIKNQRDQ